MASYLLLRNNKESGPYSLEALIQLGLKPYDLVWIEGRSAAWRYPSEVDDLKFYAPVIEEQPYDRFYKKPSDEKKEKEAQPVVKVKQAVIAETEQQTIHEINNAADEVEIKTPKKQVFVSMPANTGRTVFIKKTDEVKTTIAASAANSVYNDAQDSFKKPEPVSIIASASPSYSELVNDYNSNHSTEKKVFTNDKAPVYNESSLETKYSQSLDDIKDIYVQTLVDRKRKTAQRKMIMTLVKKVLPFAAVLIVGFMMGIFMMNKKNGKEIVPSSQQAIIPKSETAIAKPDVSAANNNQSQQQPATQTTPQENKTVANPVTDLTKTGDTKKDVALADKQNSTAIPVVNTKKNSSKENKTTTAAGNNATVLTQPKNIEPDPTTGERNKVVRSEADNNTNPQSAPVRLTANTAWKQVSVKSNDYKRGTFGGIHDLQLTVTNNTNYLLDNVVVELQYLKPGNEPLKTDNVRFSPIPPNGSLTLAIAPTNRGVKVAYKIIHVESKAAGNDTAGLK